MAVRARLPAQPLAHGARAGALDVLRGLALLGILLMNLEGFAGPLAQMGAGVSPASQGLDRWADVAIYVLVQGKFIALFSLLLGAGFALMTRRASAEGWSLAPVWWRRCLALLLIGLVHALLVWSGDILVTYAVCGVALLAFREVLGRLLACIGLVLFLVPAALSLLVGLGESALANDPAWQQALQVQGARVLELEQAQQLAYGSGDFMAATLQRAHDLGQTLASLPINGVQVFGLFLIGAWLVDVLARPRRHRRMLAWMRFGALPLGLATMLVSVALSPWIEPGHADLRTCVASALASAASLPLCLGYVGWVLWALQRAWSVPMARVLADAGRLALSNYLLQSLACTWVFYGYGLGAFGLARHWQVVFALGLFASQLGLSCWWLSRWRMGPAEWLLRTGTYARMPAKIGTA